MAPAVVASAPVALASAKPLRAAAKPRIAVAPFITKSKSFSVWGNTFEARNWLDTLVDHMSLQLDRIGSFRTLDRSFGPEIDRELNRIVNDPNANPNDVCRLSQKLATDYLVVAEATFSDVAFSGKTVVDFGHTAENPLDKAAARTGLVVAHYTGAVPAGLSIRTTGTGIPMAHAKTRYENGDVVVTITRSGFSVIIK